MSNHSKEPKQATTVAPKQTTTIIGLHGMVAPFDPTEEWSKYTEQLHLYFTGNDITAEDKHQAILLNAVWPATYCLMKTLVSQAKGTNLLFEEIVVQITAHFNPKSSPNMSSTHVVKGKTSL